MAAEQITRTTSTRTRTRTREQNVGERYENTIFNSRAGANTIRRGLHGLLHFWHDYLAVQAQPPRLAYETCQRHGHLYAIVAYSTEKQDCTTNRPTRTFNKGVAGWASSFALPSWLRHLECLDERKTTERRPTCDKRVLFEVFVQKAASKKGRLYTKIEEILYVIRRSVVQQQQQQQRLRTRATEDEETSTNSTKATAEVQRLTKTTHLHANNFGMRKREQFTEVRAKAKAKTNGLQAPSYE
eukprot:6265349-Amphidinium_carterae.7